MNRNGGSSSRPIGRNLLAAWGSVTVAFKHHHSDSGTVLAPAGDRGPTVPKVGDMPQRPIPITKVWKTPFAHADVRISVEQR